MRDHNSQTRRSFLDLPAEVRNQVYALVVHRKYDVEKRLVPVLWPAAPESNTRRDRLRRKREDVLRNGAPRWRHTIQTTPPAHLASTCRQVNREFTSMLYASHVIMVSPFAQLWHRDARSPALTAGDGNWVAMFPLEFLERTTLAGRRRTTIDSCPPALLLCSSLVLKIDALVSPAARDRWVAALDFLAHNAAALRCLRIVFHYYAEIQQCLPARTYQNNRRDWKRRRPVLIEEARTMDVWSRWRSEKEQLIIKHPGTFAGCVVLDGDAAFVRVLGRFRSLNRFKIEGICNKALRPLLEECIDPDLVIRQEGHTGHVLASPWYVDYIRREPGGRSN
ncbi:uncharacterized protein B0I36DRAFT_324787 [Microdochium trichocladiopsis]|uniref:Uncharacterized protein n=1 Tax=Microdochium trichocladiopsis TaxID=1682393 RepID=A0A9P8Y1Z0_9PEZI|nr:uncharacterized protein B0I36DRAFT_324787 [Microdochium trichocladiopsis]KAH7028964.1 hypothetical protein B0I36DRAFT_324787 [Microdochium trichocladiopsis]